MAREGGETEVGATSQMALQAKGGFWIQLWEFLKLKTNKQTKQKNHTLIAVCEGSQYRTGRFITVTHVGDDGDLDDQVGDSSGYGT